MKAVTRVGMAVCIAILAVGVLAGCMQKAPKLSPEQLGAGVIAQQHPVNQEQATARGCDCHLK